MGVAALVAQSDYSPGLVPEHSSGSASGYSSGAGPTTPYSRPTDALHGQALASYLADHYSDRVARRVSGR